MIDRRSYFGILLALAVPVGAQNLPTPASRPQPQPQTPNKPEPAQTPVVLDDSKSSEEPLILGDPVRHQGSPNQGTPNTQPSFTPPTVPPGKTAPTPAKTTPQPAQVAGVSITGLKDGDAVAKLKTALAPKLKEPFRLIIGDYQYTFLRSELGATLPVWPMMRDARTKGSAPYRLQVDSAQLEKALRELAPQVHEDFENTELNVGASIIRVKMALEQVPPADSVQVVTRTVIEPTPTPEPTETPEPPKTASGKVGNGKYPYLVASFSTRYDASLRGRTTNLRMAASHINGTIVPAGSVFSTNNAIGPRNAASGWREAKMFVSGKVVSGTGAGICQAASTLYNAALLANFPIVERHAHSMRVMYVPPSRDAALMWGSKDFKFRNNTGGDLKVETTVSGGKFHVKLWGQKPKSSGDVQIISQVLSRANGTRSVAYKIVDGQKVRLSRDSYAPHP